MLNILLCFGITITYICFFCNRFYPSISLVLQSTSFDIRLDFDTRRVGFTPRYLSPSWLTTSCLPIFWMLWTTNRFQCRILNQNFPLPIKDLKNFKSFSFGTIVILFTVSLTGDASYFGFTWLFWIVEIRIVFNNDLSYNRSDYEFKHSSVQYTKLKTESLNYSLEWKTAWFSIIWIILFIEIPRGILSFRFSEKLKDNVNNLCLPCDKFCEVFMQFKFFKA